MNTTAIKNITGRHYVSYDLANILANTLMDSGIQQGIVGIKLPANIGMAQEQEFYTALFHMGINTPQGSIQLVLLPPPLQSAFNPDDKTQMESLSRRVQRDHDDAIRYNRVYIALYPSNMSDAIIPHHDLFIELLPYHFEIMGTVTDNRK